MSWINIRAFVYQTAFKLIILASANRHSPYFFRNCTTENLPSEIEPEFSIGLRLLSSIPTPLWVCP